MAIVAAIGVSLMACGGDDDDTPDSPERSTRPPSVSPDRVKRLELRVDTLAKEVHLLRKLVRGEDADARARQPATGGSDDSPGRQDDETNASPPSDDEGPSADDGGTGGAPPGVGCEAPNPPRC